MYVKVKIMHNVAMVFMLNNRKILLPRYRSFLDTLYMDIAKQYSPPVLL